MGEINQQKIRNLLTKYTLKCSTNFDKSKKSTVCASICTSTTIRDWTTFSILLVAPASHNQKSIQTSQREREREKEKTIKTKTNYSLKNFPKNNKYNELMEVEFEQCETETGRSYDEEGICL